MSRKLFSLSFDVSLPDTGAWPRLLRALLPHPGNVLFTLLVVAGLLWATSAGALPLRAPAAASTSTGTIAYQGRLADADGNPLTGTYNMIFRLYDVPTGGTPLWTEQWTGSNGVRVSDGLFNVMLGSLTSIPQSVITGHDSLFLGITVGTDDEMTPRVQLGSVPFAVQALTVPDGSVTSVKLADSAVTSAKIQEGAVMTSKLNIDADLDVRDHWMRNAAGIAASPGGNTNIHADSDRYPNSGWPKGGWMWLKSVSSTHDPGSVRIHVAKDLTVGNAPFFDVWRVRSDAQAARLFMLDENGNLSTVGTKSAIVQTNMFGERKLYAPESPEVRFFDEGLARLKDGMVRVTLDPIFRETIEGDYLVHVTPYGDASLYVAEIGKDYFVVKAREGDPNVAFAWRLSAYRKGYAGVRLEEVRTAEWQD